MERIQIGDVSLDMRTVGEGPPLLFLHGGDYFAQNHGFLEELARRWRVLVPRHPGFGGSERPDWFRTVHDIAYLYLDLLDREGQRDVTVVGSSIGGWIALEMCVRSVERIGRLVLIDTLGVKFGGREQRDIADIYALPADEVLRRTFFSPSERAAPDYSPDSTMPRPHRSRATGRPLRFMDGVHTCTIPVCADGCTGYACRPWLSGARTTASCRPITARSSVGRCPMPASS